MASPFETNREALWRAATEFNNRQAAQEPQRRRMPTSLDEYSDMMSKWNLSRKLRTPISELITGTSFGDRLNILGKRADEVLAEESRRANETGKVPNRLALVTRMFLKQLPAATADALVRQADLTPADIALLKTLPKIGKMPMPGTPTTTIGRVAAGAKMGPGFMKDVKEIGALDKVLKRITPFSSRGDLPATTNWGNVSAAEAAKFPVVTSKALEGGPATRQYNLSRYPENTQAAMKKVIENDPEFMKRNVITWEQTEQMAQNLESMGLVDAIAKAPSGTLAAQMYRKAMITNDTFLSGLNQSLDDVHKFIVNDVLAKEQLAQHSKVSSELGRALNISKAPIQSNQAIADRINALIAEARSPENIAKRGRMATDQIVKDLVTFRQNALSKEFNPTYFDKAYEYWVNSILSGPYTHGVNIVSNTTFALSKPIEKAIYAAVDTVMSKLGGGKRQHYFSEIPQQLRGLAYGLKRGVKGLVTPATEKTKYDPIKQSLATIGPNGENITISWNKDMGPVANIRGKFGRVVRIPTQALVAEDNFFKKIVGYMELYGRAEATAKQEGLIGKALVDRRNGLIANPTTGILEQVGREQLYRTFQDDTGLGILLQQVPHKWGGRWLLPFRRTLASIITKGVERTPLGFSKVGGRMLRSKLGEVKKPYTQYEKAIDIGNAAAGTAMAAGLAYAYAKGTITGAPPKNPAKRDLWYRQGNQPYSVILPNGMSVPFSRLEPFGTAAMMELDVIQKYMDSDEPLPEDKAMEAAMKLTNFLTNKSFLNVAVDTLQAITDPGQHMQDLLTKVAGGFVPAAGLMRNIANMTDLGVKPKDLGFGETFKKSIPGLSRTIPNKVDVLGREVKREPVGFTRYTPFQVTRRKKDTVVDELLRLDYNINYPSKDIKISPTAKLELSREDYFKFLERSGNWTFSRLEKRMNTPFYKGLKDSAKKAVITALIRGGRSKERADIRKIVKQGPSI